MRITHATEQGPRSTQEDRLVICKTESYTILAVFDGHGGTDTAETAAQALPGLASMLEGRSLEELFDALSALCLSTHAGATATIARITGDTVEWGVMGDSPIALRRKDGSLFVGPCHNIRTNEIEREAAIQRGGIVEHGYLFPGGSFMGLQMSRALGDDFMGDVLLRKPETGSLQVGPGDVLILASDGVLYEGADLERLFRFRSATALVRDALERDTHDNVSAIRVSF